MAKSKKAEEWVTRTDRFINPYNFVGLGQETERKVPEYGELTGKISCTIIVKTPLAIPDSGMSDSGKHKIYKFFRVDGQPVITGSQIKGMVRSYYEALSNSCLSVSNNDVLSARSQKPRNPGLIQYKKGRWHLYPAKMEYNKNQRGLHYDEFLREWYDIEGKEVKSYIFSCKDSEIECYNLDKAVEDYYENIKIYDKEESYFQRYKGKLTYKLRKDASSDDMSPVFYEIVRDDDGNNIVYLSPSQIGRSVFRKRIDDILKTHKSCSKTDGSCLCKACTLFGIVGDSWARASRLRFSDAKAVEGTFFSDNNVTLRELSSPKTTSVEFYTRRPENAASWNYESKVMKDNRCNSDRIFCDVELNGRKFYLHNPKLKKSDYSTNEKTERNSTMEICNSGAEFEFSVYFENITESQLKELVWTLALGENSVDSDRMFKLGHGKPLGLGSVKVIVNSIDIRKFDIETFTYNIENKSPSEYLSENSFYDTEKYYNEFISIINFRITESYLNKGTVISYPIADDMTNHINSKVSHQLFMANRASGKDGTSTDWTVNYILPKITSKQISLPSYEKREKKFNSTGNCSNTAGRQYSRRSDNNSNQRKSNTTMSLGNMVRKK